MEFKTVERTLKYILNIIIYLPINKRAMRFTLPSDIAPENYNIIKG